MESTTSLHHYYLLTGCTLEKEESVQRAAHKLNGLSFARTQRNASDPGAWLLTLSFVAPATNALVDHELEQQLAPILVSAQRISAEEAQAF